MIYISIPVHENVPVIVDQLQNFARFMPRAVAVLHISPSADFEHHELQAALKAAALSNVVLNPRQEQTSWAGIIKAHLSNIAMIEASGDATHVVFHSSNDMLVRSGAEDHLRQSGTLFHVRPVRGDSHWWVGNEAVADEVLRRALATLGSTRVIGSQIEGSCYEADGLFEAARLITATGAHLGPRHYPREEILFPTFSHALGVRPSGVPYVFSEVHRFDRLLWEIFDQTDLLIDRPNRLSRLFKRYVNLACFKWGSFRLTEADVNRVATGQACSSGRERWMNDGRSLWEVLGSPLFGVKRVERDLQDPLRCYIRGLK